MSKIPNRETREFDMIIFGASGYTGQFLVEKMSQIAPSESIKWAVAGRNESKIVDSLVTASQYTGIDVNNTTIILATLDDEMSIIEMCRRTKLLLNCVGPYVFYGELVLKTCIENKTDHIDISGEPYFLEKMQLRYNKHAEETEVYAIGAAGVCTVAMEVGLQFLKNNFNGDVNSVDFIVGTGKNELEEDLHYGTFESWLYIVKMNSEREKQRKILFPNKLPKNKHLSKKKIVFYSEDLGYWCSGFNTLDCTTENTEYYNYEKRNMRPTSTNMYKSYGKYGEALSAFIVIEYILWFIAWFSWGRYILKKYHNQLFGNAISKVIDRREILERLPFKLAVVGLGYSTKFKNPNEQHMDRPNKKMVVIIEGQGSCYILTAIMMINTALCVLKEREKLPNKGGVLPTGAALLNTSLIKRLEEGGITFTVLSETFLKDLQ